LRVVDRLATTGPFKTKLVVEAKSEEEDPRSLRAILETASIDDARSTRLVVLDPRRFSFLNGIDRETRGAIRAAMGVGDEKLPVQWASSAVFAVVNTQRRRNARAAVTDYVAWTRVVDNAAVKADEDMKAEATEKRSAARKVMDDAVRRAYQHIVYLGRGDGGEGRADKEFRFEQDNQSALDGSIVRRSSRSLARRSASASSPPRRSFTTWWTPTTRDPWMRSETSFEARRGCLSSRAVMRTSSAPSSRP
jgi:hypothetical protein